MEETVRKPKNTKKKVRDSERESKHVAKRDFVEGSAYEEGDSFSMGGVLERALPIISLVLAFAAVVLFYRKFMPQPKQADATETMLMQEQSSSSMDQDAYAGLEDKWVEPALFTTGNMDLDTQVKLFCDALSDDELTAAENAQNVYNNIVWSTVEERAEGEKPAGGEWAIVSARHYFSGGSPADGIGGSGDEYEFAAVASYCLQYFGFTDAWAVPILRGSAETGQTSGAIVLVINEDGQECLCDPLYATDGWMLDRESYPFTVEDIGQDLSKAEAMGLRVQTAPSVGQGEMTGSSLLVDESVSAVERTGESQSSYDYSSDSGYGGYSDYSEYDDTYGYY